MIRIIYGCFGGSKSNKIYDLMKEDASAAHPSYLIVPEQQTVQCERKLLDLLPPSAQLHTEALNFSRLANLVFRKYGGLSYNYADKGAKTLIMWKNLKELSPLLTEYGKAASETSLQFSSEMLSAVGELKAYCISPQRLEAASKKLSDSALLSRKLWDLSLIYSSYQNFLSESFSDASDDLSKLSEMLKKHDFFKGKNVYIDSFTDFTAQEMAVIEEIFKGADNVTVALTLDSPASCAVHYESTARTFFALSALAKKLSKELITEKLEGENEQGEAIGYIARELWTPNARAFEGDASGSVSIIAASDPYEEAEAATNAVLKLLSAGMRCRDIAIIARDASLYRGIIDTSLSRAGIPYFFSQNSDIMSKPLIKFLLAALKIRVYNWRSEDVISYLKTGLCKVEERDVDLFENYLTVWNLRARDFVGGDLTMNPDGYKERFSDRTRDVLQRVNVCKNTFVPPLLRLFARLDDAQSAAQMCRAVYLFMEEHEISKVLSEKASSDYENGKRREAAELLQLYNASLKALQSIATSLGDSEIGVAEFMQALKIMFDSISVGAIPTAKDQVTVGSASMLRTDEIKCTIIIGLNEGEFPQNVKESGVFSDADKKLLDGVGITLSSNTSSRSSDELFYAYRAMSAPSEKLILLYHRSDIAGAVSFPSLAIERVKKLFPSVSERSYSSFELSDRLLSKQHSFEALRSLRGTKEGTALSKYFDSNEAYSQKISFSDTPLKNENCKLSSETTSELFSKKIYLSQSLIDDYIGCPFGYMCENLFDLRELEPAKFDYRDFGTFVHYIFERYLRGAVEDGRIGKEPDEAYIQRRVSEISNEYLSRFFTADEMISRRLSYRFKRLRRLAALVATSLTREFADSSFRPEFFELNMGRSGGDISLPPVSLLTNESNKVFISGTVDRVDLWRRGEEIFIRVIDYKSGKKTFDMSDLDTGENIQLPLYLFALCDERSDGFRRAVKAAPTQRIVPAGAMYLSSLISPIDKFKTEYSVEDALRSAESAIDRSGFLTSDIDVLRAMSGSLSEQYLCKISTDKNGELKGKALVGDGGMEVISDKLSDTVSRIADSIISGKMDAAPSVSDGDYNCKYCKMYHICRSRKK